MEVAPSHLVGEGSLDDEITIKWVSLENVFGLVTLTSLSIEFLQTCNIAEQYMCKNKF
jgi:hypothetical protein